MNLSTTNSDLGYYLFFESESDNDYYDYYYGWDSWGSVDRSKLKSPKIDGNIKQCLQFWYHMYGKSMYYILFSKLFFRY